MRRLKQENGSATLFVLLAMLFFVMYLVGMYIYSANAQATQIEEMQVIKETYEQGINHIDDVYETLAQKNEPTPSPTPTPTPNVPGKPDSNGIYTENSTINGGTPEAFNPEIPKGFKPKDEGIANWGNGSTPPSEEAVKAGLIIQDAEGNEFVWIAVDGETVKLNRYTFASDGTETEQGEAMIGNYYQELASSNKKNTVAKDINAFKTSVANHGGYYIARYEASYGDDGKPNSKVSIGTPNKLNGEAYAPKVGQLWNNITQPKAATACRNMYDSNYGATSDLMNSYAWDTAIVFIQKYSGDADYSIQESLNTTIDNTGENQDEKCHIHDMASNCAEWTTETSSFVSYPCVHRGGKGNLYTSGRNSNISSGAFSAYSFRPILYL